MLDGDGNLRAADIGITWEDNETFLHGVRVVGPGPSRRPGMRPAMSTPHQPMGGRHRDDSPSTAHQQTQPLMSTPYLTTLGQDRDDSPSTVHQQTRPVMSTPYQPTLGQDRDLGPSSVRPVTPEVDYQTRRPPTETRQGYRPAAPIQRFNNKSLKLQSHIHGSGGGSWRISDGCGPPLSAMVRAHPPSSAIESVTLWRICHVFTAD